MRGDALNGAALRLEAVSKQYRLRTAPNRSLVGELAGLAHRFRPGAGLMRRRETSALAHTGASAAPAPRWRAFWALRDLSLSVCSGELVGVIGSNGAGKSTLFKLIAGVTIPTCGWLAQSGRLGALIEVGAGIHPELTGRENIYQYGSIMGMSWREIRTRFADIVEFAALDGFIDQPVKRYSSGMQMRLGFSVAAHVEPNVLLVDEVLAVGDEAFQTRCLNRIEALRDGGAAILFTSHDLAAVERMCDRVLWLDHGRLLMSGSPAPVVAAYRAREN